MRFGYYFDLKARYAGPDEFAPRQLRSLMLQRLHHLIAQDRQGVALAVLPNGEGLRLFCADGVRAADVRGRLASIPLFRDYVQLGEVQEVPVTFTGPWVAWCRYRIPTARSDRNAQGGISALRNRRLAHAVEEGMEYFTLRSGSNGHRHSMYVHRVQVDQPDPETCVNSYGFSTTTHLVALPDLN